jgi:hypothetical protein
MTISVTGSAGFANLIGSRTVSKNLTTLDFSYSHCKVESLGHPIAPYLKRCPKVRHLSITLDHNIVIFGAGMPFGDSAEPIKRKAAHGKVMEHLKNIRGLTMFDIGTGKPVRSAAGAKEFRDAEAEVRRYVLNK